LTSSNKSRDLSFIHKLSLRSVIKLLIWHYITITENGRIIVEVQSTPIKPYVFDLFEFDELINTPRTKEVKKPVPPPPPPKPKSFIIEPVDDPEPVSKPEVIPEEKNLDDKNIIDEPAVAYYEPTPEPAPIAAPVVEEVDDKVYDFVDRMPCYESCFDDENPITRKRCTDKILMEQIYETLRL